MNDPIKFTTELQDSPGQHGQNPCAFFPRKYDHSNFPGKPVQQGDAREKALAEGLTALFTKFGRKLRGYLHIDSRGEFELFLEAGQTYGDELAELLSKHSPRTGVFSTKYLGGYNSWCLMNHFDVAKLLEEAGV